MSRLLAVWAVVWLGCTQSDEGQGGCPCSAPLVCCAATNRCATDETCLEAPQTSDAPLEVLSVTPSTLPRAGGVLRVELSASVDDPSVAVGGRPCPVVSMDGATVECQAQPGDDLNPWADVRVAHRGSVALAPRAVRYRLPAMTDVTDRAGVGPTPNGLGMAVVDLFGTGARDVLLSRTSETYGPELWRMWRQVGVLQYVNQASAGWISAHPAQAGFTPLFFDDDDRVDLWVWTARSHGRDRQIGYVLSGASGFLTEAAVDLPELTRTEYATGLPLDIDGDGRSEIVGVRRHTEFLDRAFFVVRDGAEVLPPPFDFDLSALRAAPDFTTLELIDFDDDADADVVVCGDALWLFSNEGGRFVARDMPQLAGCSGLAVADMNGDGHQDIVAVLGGHRGPQGIAVLLNTGDGGWALAGRHTRGEPDCGESIVPGSTLRAGSGRIAAFDVDADGDMDLLMASSPARCAQPATLYRNVSDGARLRFEVEPVGSTWSNVSTTAIVADDLDGDGDLDIVSRGWAYGTRGRILRNNAAEDGTLGRWLAVRATRGPGLAHGARIDVARDGPDFRPEPGLAVAIVGHEASSASDGPEYFGLGDTPGPWFVRVRFPGGAVVLRQVDTPNQVIDVDWAEASQ